LLLFLNTWIELNKSSGRLKEAYDYWIQGINAKPKTKRWSILKDVILKD
jgi:hypothetical protein